MNRVTKGLNHELGITQAAGRFASVTEAERCCNRSPSMRRGEQRLRRVEDGARVLCGDKEEHLRRLLRLTLALFPVLRRARRDSHEQRHFALGKPKLRFTFCSRILSSAGERSGSSFWA